MKTLIVYDIKVNNNKAFLADIPLEYAEYPELVKPWLRTFVFDHLTVEYKIIPTKDFHLNSLTTETKQQQSYIPDLLEENYSYYIKYLVTPIVKNYTVVNVDELTLKCADDDLKQAVFEKLQETFEIDFIARRLKDSDVVEYNFD